MVVEGLSEERRQVVAAAWAYRWDVELDARARFRSFAQRLQQIGEPDEIVKMAESASEDEARHAEHCRRIAARYGYTVEAVDEADRKIVEIAPPGWEGRPKLLYEIVAACCVAETESVSVLLDLLTAAPQSDLEPVLRELARDEVQHARLGWTCLARGRQAGSVSYLAPVIPGMLRGNADAGLFDPSPPEREAPELLQHGVLPLSRKRELFVRTAEDVIFPGLEEMGVDSGAGRRWLNEQLPPAKP